MAKARATVQPPRRFIPARVDHTVEFNLASEFMRGKREENPNLGYSPLALRDYIRMVELAGNCAKTYERSLNEELPELIVFDPIRHDPNKTMPSTPRGDVLFYEGATALLDFLEEDVDHDLQ